MNIPIDTILWIMWPLIGNKLEIFGKYMITHISTWNCPGNYKDHPIHWVERNMWVCLKVWKCNEHPWMVIYYDTPLGGYRIFRQTSVDSSFLLKLGEETTTNLTVCCLNPMKSQGESAGISTLHPSNESPSSIIFAGEIISPFFGKKHLEPILFTSFH